MGVLKLFLLQIKKFPVDKNTVSPVRYATYYPCFRFKKFNDTKLTESIIFRIQNRKDDYNRGEIYLLSCLSKKDKKAADFLIKMGKSTFQTNLSKEDRESQLANLNFALADLGFEENVNQVIAEIESGFKNPQSSENFIPPLEEIRQFTNCKILEKYISHIGDKREIKINEYINREYKSLKAQVGDRVIQWLTGTYGTQGTGLNSNEFKSFTDSEKIAIYRKVTKFINRNVNSSCKISQGLTMIF